MGVGSDYAIDFFCFAFDLIVAGIVYRIALDSAVEAAEKKKEAMIASLSSNQGPIAA